VTGDRLVLTRAQAGDAEAFRMIFDRHAPSVRRFLGDLLRDDGAADEATQETFVRAHAGLSSLANLDVLRSWLFGIARLVSLEALRRPRSLRLEEAAVQIDRAPSPEVALLTREADAVLAAALATLSEERRAALVLRLDHGLGYEEIATAMGWSAQKVKNEIHRARLELRTQVKSYLEAEPCT
jgi:RNA polymerase sigma-70 factor (ECF subfamily)